MLSDIYVILLADVEPVIDEHFHRILKSVLADQLSLEDAAKKLEETAYQAESHHAQSHLGLSILYRDKHNQALRHLLLAEGIFERINNIRGLAHVRFLLSQVYAAKKQWTRALELVQLASDLLPKEDTSLLGCIILLQKGVLLLELNSLPQAAQIFQQVLACSETLSFDLQFLAQVYLVTIDYKEQRYNEAWQRIKPLLYQLESSHPTIYYGKLNRLAGQTLIKISSLTDIRIQSLLQRAIDIFAELDHQGEFADTLLIYGQYLMDVNQIERAKHFLHEALKVFFDLNEAKKLTEASNLYRQCTTN